jgi:hypothetical protein
LLYTRLVNALVAWTRTGGLWSSVSRRSILSVPWIRCLSTFQDTALKVDTAVSRRGIQAEGAMVVGCLPTGRINAVSKAAQLAVGLIALIDVGMPIAMNLVSKRRSARGRLRGVLRPMRAALPAVGGKSVALTTAAGVAVESALAPAWDEWEEHGGRAVSGGLGGSRLGWTATGGFPLARRSLVSTWPQGRNPHVRKDSHG